MKDLKNIKRILIIRTDRVGDFLLNIPVIKALRKSFPQSFIAVIVKPEISELIEKDPDINEIIVDDDHRQRQGFSNAVRLLKKIRQRNFDLAIILNPAKKFNLITFLAGIPHRIGYDRKWGFLLTHKIKDRKYLAEKHEVEYNLDLLRLIGIEPDDKEISLTLTGEDQGYIDHLLKGSGIEKGAFLVALHPWTSNPAKKWPQNNFLEVGERLVSELNAKITVIGGSEEREAAESFCRQGKGFINLCGKFSWRQLAAFLKHCALLISNDSGPAHIAAAVKTPCVVIFGRNIPGVGPKRWRSWGEGHIVLHKDPGCAPCLDRNCPYNFKCLTSITPGEVFETVEKKFKSFKSYKSLKVTKI